MPLEVLLLIVSFKPTKTELFSGLIRICLRAMNDGDGRVDKNNPLNTCTCRILYMIMIIITIIGIVYFLN